MKKWPIFRLCWSCAGKTPVVWMLLFSSVLYSGCLVCSVTNNLSPVHLSVQPSAHEVSIVFHVSALFQEREGVAHCPYGDVQSGCMYLEH